MSGLDHRVMHRALNDVARRIMNGRRLAAGDALEHVLAGVPVAIEQVADEALRETVTWSGWFHRQKPAALAIVWPDKNGVFAWQPGAPGILDELQPLGWRVPIERTGGLATDPAWGFPVPPEHRAFSCTHVVDDGEAVLWAARESDEARGEDWSIHCGALGHHTDDMRIVHLAHLVRSAPSLRELSDLGLGEEALRADPDSPWATAPLPRCLVCSHPVDQRPSVSYSRHTIEVVRTDEFDQANGNPGDVKRVGRGVSELRLTYGPGYRVYYLQDAEILILQLCGGDKS